MTTRHACPGYAADPFATLASETPGPDVYPTRDFRTEWGPIFHRGRLDGTATILVLGQDPATHEAITRRILVGEAGQRVQGLLGRIGIDRSYVMINTFLYSVYGQGGGTRHATDPAIAAYRHRWLDALLLNSAITTVITLGGLAKTAYQTWTATQQARAQQLLHVPVRHPTFPESATRSGGPSLIDTTQQLLTNWNAALPTLAAHVVAERPATATPYGSTWQRGDLRPIPADDLPAGSPSWWRDLDAWATRTGATATAKRATITITVPRHAQSWRDG